MSNEETKAGKTFSRKRPFPDGSPIIVGGGGGVGDDDDKDKVEGRLSCVFNENDYAEPAGIPGKKHFRHAGWHIKTFKIGTKDGIVDHSNILPDGGNCIIVIHCVGDEDDVTINGNSFGIDMDTRTYRKDPEGAGHTNPNADSYISRIDLITPGKDPHSWFFDKSDGCAVCTDYITNSPACS